MNRQSKIGRAIGLVAIVVFAAALQGCLVGTVDSKGDSAEAGSIVEAVDSADDPIDIDGEAVNSTDDSADIDVEAVKASTAMGAASQPAVAGKTKPHLAIPVLTTADGVATLKIDPTSPKDASTPAKESNFDRAEPPPEPW